MEIINLQYQQPWMDRNLETSAYSCAPNNSIPIFRYGLLGYICMIDHWTSSIDQGCLPGGDSLCDGWYICAAVLTPFFHFGRIEHDLFGVFFSSTNSKAIFWGTKTTNFYKNRSFWPQIQIFPRSFWVQFSAASGTPPSVFRPSTPRGLPRFDLIHSIWLERWKLHHRNGDFTVGDGIDNRTGEL